MCTNCHNNDGYGPTNATVIIRTVRVRYALSPGRSPEKCKQRFIRVHKKTVVGTVGRVGSKTKKKFSRVLLPPFGFRTVLNSGVANRT